MAAALPNFLGVYRDISPKASIELTPKQEILVFIGSKPYWNPSRTAYRLLESLRYSHIPLRFIGTLRAMFESACRLLELRVR